MSNISISQVTYLGHIFLADGMEPDPKVSAAQEWVAPIDSTSTKSFVGLASIYSLLCRHRSSTLLSNKQWS